MALRAAVNCHRVVTPQRVTQSSGYASRASRSSCQARYSLTAPSSQQKVDRVSHLHLNTDSEIRNNSHEKLQNRHMKKEEKMLSPKEFKEKYKLESLEKFSQSPYVKAATRGDVRKIQKAYDDYCNSEYTAYQKNIYGGNPATMT